MNRREFFRRTTLGAAVALSVPGSGNAGIFSKDPPVRRPFEFEEFSIAELQSRMNAGTLTALALTGKYLARIREVDRRGPAINSVIELNPDAMEIARALDRERKAKGPRGPLHGIPILIKDNIDTHDRMGTTAGSLALAGLIAPRDAFLVERLRASGAVLLGKTNLSEWANFRSWPSTSGWSGRGGLTRNPYVLDRNPSGSSSGSGAAVAANLCAAAVGTETDGSILSPSSVTGIVGIKPTVGLVSRAGIIPISHSQDTAGPMARTVADAALLLGVLAGADPRDAATAASAGRGLADYTRFLDPDGLRGARLGIARKLFGVHSEAARRIEELIGEMKRLGAEIIDPADLPSHGKMGDAEIEVLLHEFKAGLNAYLATRGDAIPARSLKELIAFNERNRAKEMPFFGQSLFLQAEEKGPLTDNAYLDALEKCRRLSRTEGIDAVMDRHRLDALVAPTTGPARPTDLALGDGDVGGSSTPAAVAGYPSITVPAGFVAGLPFGISFFGRAFSESVLIRIAFAFEQATKVRRPPKFFRSISV